MARESACPQPRLLLLRRPPNAREGGGRSVKHGLHTLRASSHAGASSHAPF